MNGRGEGVMLRSGWVHRLPCFNANAAAGLSSSQPGRGHARPPQLCLPEVAMPAASMAPQQLRWHDHPVSAPRAVETCWPRTAVGARADKQAIYTPRVTPGELGSGQQLGRKSGLETPSHRGGGLNSAQTHEHCRTVRMRGKYRLQSPKSCLREPGPDSGGL